MTREHLLDAMGLIDDALIRDAEVRPAPLAVPWRRWGAWAACLALVLVLGYGVTRLGMGGSLSGSSGAGAPPAGGASPSSSSGGSMGSLSGDGSSSGSGAPVTSQGAGASGVDGAAIFTPEEEYRLTGQTLDALPEGSRSLGALSARAPDGPLPATDDEEYVGLVLWQGPDGLTVYLQLEEGTYAAAQALAEP